MTEFPYHRALSKYESRVDFAKASDSFSRLISTTDSKLRNVLREVQKSVVKHVGEMINAGMNPRSAGNFRVDVGQRFYEAFREFLIEAWREGKDQGFDELPERIKRAARAVKQYHLPDEHDQLTHGNWATGGAEKPLEVYLTPDQVERYKDSWGGGEIGFQIKGQPGAFWKGTIISRDQIPGTIYHVTTAKDAVESSGYLLGRNDGGGMGGGNGLAGVSLTTSKETAEFIAREMTRSATLAQTVRSRDDYVALLDKFVAEDYGIGGATQEVSAELAKAKGFALDSFDANIDQYIKYRQDEPDKFTGNAFAVLASETYSSYLQMRSNLAYKDFDNRNTHPLRNPLLMGGNDARMKQKPDQIGIVQVKREMIPENALVRHGTDEFLQEIRVHADIPLRANVKTKKHGDTSETKEQQGFYITKRMREQIKKGIALFEDDLDARVYHAEHDQSDHGNWARGLNDKELDGMSDWQIDLDLMEDSLPSELAAAALADSLPDKDHENPNYAYHATFADRVKSIAAKGLLTSGSEGAETRWGGMLGGESVGKVFFANSAKDAGFYAEIVVRGQIENGERQMPDIVFLRAKRDSIEIKAVAKELQVASGVEPDKIEIWHHGEWKRLAPLKKFHLPGEHDQESHGNWASGGGEGAGSKPPLEHRDKFVGEYPDTGEYGDAAHNAYHAREKEWQNRVREELSFGRMTVEQANALGYREHHGEWIDLPSELYHVTVAASAVERGGLKSRTERSLGEDADGVGGGPNETISITESKTVAEGIYKGMMEAREVALGNVTAQDLWQQAIEGRQADRPFARDMARGYANNDQWNFGDPLPPNLQTLFDETTYVSATEHRSLIMPRADMPKDATPVGDGIVGGDGVTRYVGYHRPMTAQEKADSTMEFFRRWTAYREHAGGPYNPVFWGAPFRLARIDPEQIKILNLKPKPSARGVSDKTMRMAEGEYRLYRGDVVEIVGSSKPVVKLFSLKSYAGFEPRQAIDYLTTKALVIKGLLDNELTEDVRQYLLEHLKGGRTLTETLMDLRALFEPWIGDPEKIAPSGQVGVNTPLGTKSPDNVLQAYRLENMIRTPLIEAFNQGRLAIGDATDDYVIGYQLSAILDQRTTEICESVDGLTVRVDDPRLRKLTPPLHYQCRTILVYVTIDDTPVEWSTDEELDAAVDRIQDGFS